LGESFGQIASNAAVAIQPSLGPEILSALAERPSVFKFDRINDAFLKFINTETNESFKAITFYEEVVDNEKVINNFYPIYGTHSHHVQGGRQARVCENG
jgi:hypothetical protein